MTTTGNGYYFTLQKVGDAGEAIEFGGDVSKVALPVEDREDVTFREVEDGDTKVNTIDVTALHDLSEGSFWSLMWDNPGAQFEFVAGPYGNAVASADKPHFTGLCTAKGRPPSETEARIGSRTRDWFDYQLDVDEVELDRGA